MDCTDTEACLYADISPATLYNYQKEHPEFLERKNLLKEKPFLKARKTIIDNLDKPEMALKYMERKKKKEFSPTMEISGDVIARIVSIDE